jgi:DNA-binding FadR family transcriptional regulator
MVIKRRSLADEVAVLLKKKIEDGDFPVGEKLPTEPDLMELFGVGRSTIREAVRNLVQAGIVRVQQGLGTFVEKLRDDSESLQDRFLRAKGLELNEIRQLLELKIAEKAAQNRSEEDITLMRAHLDERNAMALAHIPHRCIQADINFHLTIARASKSEMLLDLYHTIAHHMQAYFTELYFDTECFIQTQDMHESLLQSIVDKDARMAWEWAAKITGQPL